MDVLVPRGYAVDLKPPVGIAVRAIEPASAAVTDGGDAESRRLTVHVLAFFGRANVRQA